MSALFVDTSALAKRYLGEMGSTWVRAVLAPEAGNVVLISSLTTVEVASLLARRVREGALSKSDAAVLLPVKRGQPFDASAVATEIRWLSIQA